MPHPRIHQAQQLRMPETSAAFMGYRAPAEWEPQACVWVTPPHNPDTWPGCLDLAQKQFTDFLDELVKVVRVRTTESQQIPTNDSWIRDSGPLFVLRQKDGNAELACHDFSFNGWGKKYEPRPLDDVVPQQIAMSLDIPIWIHDLVLEGGSIEVNGKGTLVTTKSCLLNPNRNPELSQLQIEERLHETLGTSHVIWLHEGLEGDDTDGHIDDLARFVTPDTVVAVSAAPNHPDRAICQRNLEVLRSAQDQDGAKIQIVELPTPEPIHYDFPADPFGPRVRSTLPASYTNFLISNESVFVPVFGSRSDDEAVRRLEQVLPQYSIVPLRAEHLIVGLGAFHCLTMQQPHSMSDD